MVFDAVSFFNRLTDVNRLARQYGFRFKVVSGIDDFGDALATLQEQYPLVCVSDTSDGQFDLDNSPGTSVIKTVFMFMPHGIIEEGWQARRRCFAVMHELFRQFLSVIIREQSRLCLDGIYIDRSIHFTEMDRYFFSGGACAYFNIMVSKPTDLILRQEEWTEDPTPPRLSRIDVNTPKISTKR